LSSLLSLPLTADEKERALFFEAVLLGAGGLLPSQRPELTAHDWATTEYIDEVERLWLASARTLSLPHKGAVEGWQWDRVRPANSPLRRLAAAARLLARYAWPPDGLGLLAPFLDRIDIFSPPDLAKEWTAMLTVQGDGYWATHSDFARPLVGIDKDDVALVGSSRAADLVVNILLPLTLAYADSHGKPHLRDKACEVYALYPRLAENRITKAMAEEAFGPRKRNAIKTARHQQGLIHLYRLYCEARRCFECPVSGLMAKG
jgi:hypothetical protein